MGRTKGSKNGTSSVDACRDYNLIMRIKSGDKNAENELFELYRELIYQQYHKLKNIKFENNFKGLEIPSIEDYVADSWEPFKSAVETTKLAKITKVPIYNEEDEAQHKVYQEKSKALYKKYKALEKEDAKANASEMSQLKEEYKASEKIRKEIKANRRIVGYTDNSKGWSFYTTFWGYLKKKNEVLIAHYIKDSKNTVHSIISIDDSDEFDIADLNKTSVSPSSEEEYFKNEESKAIRTAISNLLVSKLTSNERTIFNGKLNGKTDREIMKDINISPSEYQAELDTMWLKYQAEYKSVSLS